MRLPIRVRLTLVFAVLITALLSGFGLLLYLRLGADLTRAIDAGLSSRADTVVTGLNDGGNFGDPGTAGDFDRSFAQVLGPGGSVQESTAGLGDKPVLSPRQVSSLGGSRYFERRVGPSSQEEPVLARFLALRTPDGHAVVVGQSMEQREEALGRLSMLLWIGVPVSILVVALIGYLLSGAALRPVERMREEAAAITSGEIERRLSIPQPHDEVQRLGSTLNAMLARLEGAFLQERRLVDDASHELRTPLAILRTELELAVGKARTAEELEAALHSALEETVHLDRLAEDLLVLARSERGRVPVATQRVALGEAVREACKRFATRAGESHVSLHPEVENGTELLVDPVRLRQALDNLIDNSLRHSRDGGEIRVSGGCDDHETWLKISDRGEGFPEEFVARAFEPFARSDPGRGRDHGGVGLGLSIVRAIAESHGGTASARNLPTGGAEVTVRFPRRVAGVES